MEKIQTHFQARGFTLVEIIVVVTIIGILTSLLLMSFPDARKKARDAKRKAEISQIGKFLTFSCYLPDAGGGEYDIIPLADEIIDKYPNYDKIFSNIPKDPKTGSETESKYIYIVTADGKKCALYGNLENHSDAVTLTITVPAPGEGTGILRADSPGWNGSHLYFQYSN